MVLPMPTLFGRSSSPVGVQSSCGRVYISGISLSFSDRKAYLLDFSIVSRKIQKECGRVTSADLWVLLLFFGEFDITVCFPREKDDKERRHKAYGWTPERRGWKGEPHKECSHDKARVAEDGVVACHVALWHKNHSNVGKNKNGVDGFEEAFWECRLIRQQIVHTDNNEEDKQDKGNNFFCHDIVSPFLMIYDEMLFTGYASVDAEAEKNSDCAKSGDNDGCEGINVLHRDAHRLFKCGEFLKGIAEKNKGQNFKLLCNCRWDGRGDNKDKTHKLHDKNESKSQVDWGEMAVGRMGEFVQKDGRVEASVVQSYCTERYEIDKKKEQPQGALSSSFFPRVRQVIKENNEFFKNHRYSEEDRSEWRTISRSGARERKEKAWGELGEENQKMCQSYAGTLHSSAIVLTLR